MRCLTQQQNIERASKRFVQHLQANKLKDYLEQTGYKFTISLYGVIDNPETVKSEYRRIEVFMNGQPKQVDVEAIHEFFREIKPAMYYSIWKYQIETKNLVMIGGWN